MTVNKPTIRVCVVEDDPTDLLLIEEMLRGSDRTQYSVEHISSFDDALHRLIDAQCDVLLLDFFLGKHTARDLLLEAKKTHLAVPIIVLTGLESEALDDEVIELGASDYLPKGSISRPLLERTIRHAIRHKKAELELEKLVKQDPLTGLGNRLLFEELLEKSVAKCKRSKSRLAVLFMDLDRFKEVNDSLGHPTGDLLLIMIADRLQQVVREYDVVARIGGDEFTFLVDQLPEASDALAIASKIVQAVSEPLAVGGHELNVSASVGIAFFPESGQSPVELMQKADIALYEAKRQGVKRIQCFTENLQVQLENHLSIERGLRAALANDEFQLLLQPQWRLQDQVIFGFEALLRWRSASGDFIAPGEFIQVAEKTGLIVKIGEWVVLKALSYLETWTKMGITDVGLAVNVSPVQLKTGHFADFLERAKGALQGRPSLLEIEITEETLLEGHDDELSVIKDLERIRTMGFKISIDDFGTGYSSLQYLRQFPADVVKIDKSFVSTRGVCLAEPEICRAITMMWQAPDILDT